MSLFSELKRRNVLRAVALYAAGAWALAQGVAQLLPAFGAPDWITRWFVIAAIIGFPFWAAFAWFYEFTPDGLKRESEISPGDSIAHSTGRKLDFWIIGVLAIAVVLLLTNQIVQRKDTTTIAASTAMAELPPAADIPEKSIAVMPFRNEAGKDDEQYFSDGLSEDLITALSKFDGLKVIARDSAFHFRDSKESSQAIGVQLGVAHLLSGSVRRAGDVVRISATLVKAADGSSLWSQRYDRPYKDLFALQDDITAAVSGALQARLLAQPELAQQSDHPPSGNLDAYEAVLHGNFNYAKRNKDANEKAVDDYGQAIALDPAYGYAYARRAKARIRQLTSYGSTTSEGVAQIRQDVEAGLRLAPDNAEVLIAKSYLLTTIDIDLPAALRASQRAVQLAPDNVASLNILSIVQQQLGQLEPAIAGYQRALTLDPLSERTRFNLGLQLIAIGNYAEAEEQLRIAIRQQPEAAQNHVFLAIAQLLEGRTGEGISTAKEEPDDFWRTYALALAYWADGDPTQSDEALQTLIRENKDDGASQIAAIYAQRRQPDEMFKWLDHAKTKNKDGVMNDGGVTDMRSTPFVIDYRDDPRYIALARELGLMPETAATETGQ